MQTYGTSNYHPGSGSSDPKPYACYVLTNKYIIGKKIQNYQDTEFKEANKPKGPITLEKEKKAFTGVGKVLGGRKQGGEEG